MPPPPIPHEADPVVLLSNKSRRAAGLVAGVTVWLAVATGCMMTPISASEANPLRIVTFGTSLTARGGWQEPLAAGLERCLAMPVEVLTVAKSGANSDWGVEAIDQVIAMKPQFVTVEFAANDAALHRGMWLSRSQSNMRTIVRRLQDALPGVKIILMTMNPLHGPRALVRPFLGTYYDTYQALSKELGVGFIDHRAVWNGLTAGELKEAIPDGAHPIASKAAPLIVPAMIRAIGGDRCP